MEWHVFQSYEQGKMNVKETYITWHWLQDTHLLIWSWDHGFNWLLCRANFDSL